MTAMDDLDFRQMTARLQSAGQAMASAADALRTQDLSPEQAQDLARGLHALDAMHADMEVAADEYAL
jgi:hypothetical protein